MTRNRSLICSGLLLGLSGCGGLGLKTITPPGTEDDTGQDDTGLHGISETDPPLLAALDPYRNEDLVTVEGRALPGEAVTVLVDQADRTDEYLVLADADGFFAQPVVLDRGVDVQITATNLNGPSEARTTQACMPWDAYEIDRESGDDYGDSCDDNPVLADNEFTDALSLMTLTGNVLEEGDEDWYRIVTIDEPIIEDQFFYENYNFQVDFLEGSDRYAFEVFRNGCQAESQECPGESYDTYSYFADDQEPDEVGEVPADPRACGREPFNDCADFSATYTIVVRRTDGQLNCAHYQLRVRNGSN